MIGEPMQHQDWSTGADLKDADRRSRAGDHLHHESLAVRCPSRKPKRELPALRRLRRVLCDPAETEPIGLRPCPDRRRSRQAWISAGLDLVTLHEARHACITIWAQAIANPKRVQALAGHASITMTLDRYGKHMNLGADETTAEVTRFLEKHGG